MKPNLTTLEGHLAACNRGDDLYVKLEFSGSNRPYAPLLLPTKTEIYCREHKRERREDHYEPNY